MGSFAYRLLLSALEKMRQEVMYRAIGVRPTVQIQSAPLHHTHLLLHTLLSHTHTHATQVQADYHAPELFFAGALLSRLSKPSTDPANPDNASYFSPHIDSESSWWWWGNKEEGVVACSHRQ